MPAPLPHISQSEWSVASVVWAQERLTAAEIAEQLPKTVRWKLKTVNTFLARLVSKGVLEVERDGRAFRYRALIPRERCVRAESDSFLRRVFAGATAPMLAHFCETADLTEEEIAELRRLLNQKTPAPPRGVQSKLQPRKRPQP
ncbi:MAG TPA: BlaI/MecI/CopY family transcriptional regulator [Chthoniobacteraceae bacterium]|jgi:BlaI family penicillinase repressor